LLFVLRKSDIHLVAFLDVANPPLTREPADGLVDDDAPLPELPGDAEDVDPVRPAQLLQDGLSAFMDASCNFHLAYP